MGIYEFHPYSLLQKTSNELFRIIKFIFIGCFSLLCTYSMYTYYKYYTVQCVYTLNTLLCVLYSRYNNNEKSLFYIPFPFNF